MKRRSPSRRGQRKSDDLAAIAHAMKMRALLDYLSEPVNAAESVAEPVAAVADQTFRGRARGRKPGSGAFNDDALIREMLHQLAVGAAPSVYAAADQVVDRAHSTGSRDSTRRRLARKFGKRFGTKPPEGKIWKDVEQKLNNK
jgi:hypothetical protein